MPTYKYNPDRNNIAEILSFSKFLVYDPITKIKEERRVAPGQSFATDKYLDKLVMRKASLEFVSDEPYISPIFLSYSGTEQKTLEVPDYANLIDIYVSLKTSASSYISLYFNGDKDNFINIYNSDKIFRNISVSKIRTITTIPYNKTPYTIALVDSDQFASNNTGEQLL